MTKRTFLGKYSSLAWRERVYLGDEGFEVDTQEHAYFIQRRVLYDDVQLVTYHRELGTGYMISTGLIALFFLLLAIGAYSSNPVGIIASSLFALLAAPAAIAFLLRLILRLDVITIYGRRSRARMRFVLRKKRARAVYGQVCAAVRRAQRVEVAPAGPPVSDEATGDASDVWTQ